MPSQRGHIRPLFLLSGAILGAVGAAVLLRRMDVVEVTGRSMQPTLLPGDRLLVESLTYASRAPRVGDVVIVPDPREPSRELVKRVVAIDAGAVRLAGDAPDASTDSRTFGAVPLRGVRWRVIARYWPPERIGPVPPLPAAVR